MQNIKSTFNIPRKKQLKNGQWTNDLTIPFSNVQITKKV